MAKEKAHVCEEIDFTIDLTPSWKTVTHVIAMLIESHSKPSMFKQSGDDQKSPFQYIRSELSRMGIMLDTVNLEMVEEQRAHREQLRFIAGRKSLKNG